MKTSTEKRNEYWNHFIEQWATAKKGGGHGVTGTKLAKVKPYIMDDDDFWYDVVNRHDGTNITPEALRRTAPATYAHCQGNFWGMVYQSMGDLKLI